MILVDKNQNSVNELRDQLASRHGESKIQSIVLILKTQMTGNSTKLSATVSKSKLEEKKTLVF